MTTPKDKPDMGHIEVITSVQRRRRWAPEEKRAILEEAEQLTFSPITGHSTGYNFLKFAVLGEEDGDAEGQIYRGAVCSLF